MRCYFVKSGPSPRNPFRLLRYRRPSNRKRLSSKVPVRILQVVDHLSLKRQIDRDATQALRKKLKRLSRSEYLLTTDSLRRCRLRTLWQCPARALAKLHHRIPQIRWRKSGHLLFRKQIRKRAFPSRKSEIRCSPPFESAVHICRSPALPQKGSKTYRSTDFLLCKICWRPGRSPAC